MTIEQGIANDLQNIQKKDVRNWFGKLIQKSMASETPSSTAAPKHEQAPQVPQPHLQKFTRLDAPASRNDPGISPTP